MTMMNVDLAATTTTTGGGTSSSDPSALWKAINEEEEKNGSLAEGSLSTTSTTISCSDIFDRFLTNCNEDTLKVSSGYARKSTDTVGLIESLSTTRKEVDGILEDIAYNGSININTVDEKLGRILPRFLRRSLDYHLLMNGYCYKPGTGYEVYEEEVLSTTKTTTITTTTHHDDDDDGNNNIEIMIAKTKQMKVVKSDDWRLESKYRNDDEEEEHREEKDDEERIDGRDNIRIGHELDGCLQVTREIHNEEGGKDENENESEEVKEIWNKLQGAKQRRMMLQQKVLQQSNLPNATTTESVNIIDSCDEEDEDQSEEVKELLKKLQEAKQRRMMLQQKVQQSNLPGVPDTTTAAAATADAAAADTAAFERCDSDGVVGDVDTMKKTNFQEENDDEDVDAVEGDKKQHQDTASSINCADTATVESDVVVLPTTSHNLESEAAAEEEGYGANDVPDDDVTNGDLMTKEEFSNPSIDIDGQEESLLTTDENPNENNLEVEEANEKDNCVKEKHAASTTSNLIDDDSSTINSKSSKTIKKKKKIRLGKVFSLRRHRLGKK